MYLRIHSLCKHELYSIKPRYWWLALMPRRPRSKLIGLPRGVISEAGDLSRRDESKNMSKWAPSLKSGDESISARLDAGTFLSRGSGWRLLTY